jgi:hypothetical protein
MTLDLVKQKIKGHFLWLFPLRKGRFFIAWADTAGSGSAIPWKCY